MSKSLVFGVHNGTDIGIQTRTDRFLATLVLVNNYESNTEKTEVTGILLFVNTKFGLMVLLGWLQ